MTETDIKGTASGETGTEKAGGARKIRGIRFSESEWEQVKSAAAAHQMSASEFVRERILALTRTPSVAPSLAPLIERMFRYTWFLATEKRDAMIREGRKDEVDALVAEARALHESLRSGAGD